MFSSGIQVVEARPGGLVLDVIVKHSESVTAHQAFNTFKQILKAPASTSRVQNLLQVNFFFFILAGFQCEEGSGGDGPTWWSWLL